MAADVFGREAEVERRIAGDRGIESPVARAMRQEDIVVEELKLATIHLRDAVKAAEAAKARYQAALQAFNRCVAPDNG